MQQQMCLTLWVLVGSARAILDAPCSDGTTQGEDDAFNNLLSLFNASPSYNIGSPYELQGYIGEEVSLDLTHPFDAITHLVPLEQPGDTINTGRAASDATESCSPAPLSFQEPSCSTQGRALEKPRPGKGTTSKEFRARMARDAHSLENTLPPGHAALNTTFVLMNSRVILPSAEIVRWFSNKGTVREDPLKALAVPYCRCAFNYRRVAKHIREQKETALFMALMSPIQGSASQLTRKELCALALHRSHIGLLAKHIIDSAADRTTGHADTGGQNCPQPPVFDYLGFDPLTYPRLCLCLSAQLLISGFSSYIPDPFITPLRRTLIASGAKLVSYMLSPDCVEVFPEFIAAFYIIMSDSCTDAASPRLLACHHSIVKRLPASMRLLYRKELAAQQAYLSRLVVSCLPALRALGAGGLSDGGPASPAASGVASVYWHALSALVMLTTPVLERGNLVTSKNGRADAISSVAKRTVLADYLVYLIAQPIANTASLSCWAGVLKALTLAMPSLDVYAFMVAHTPPAFAGPLLRCEVVNSTVYVIIVALWLGLEMPHADSILATLDAMYDKPAYQYKALLLLRLPVRLFARAPPGLLRKISRIVFEQERVRSLTQQKAEAPKRKADGCLAQTHYASKRGRGASQESASVNTTKEDAQYLPSGSSTGEAQAGSVAAGARRGRRRPVKKEKAPRVLTAPDDADRASEEAAFPRNPKITLSKLFQNLYIHCRTPDDITDEELASFVSNKATLIHLAKMCCAIADEKPQRVSIGNIGHLISPFAYIRTELLKIFGAPPGPSAPDFAGASGSLGSACGRGQSKASRVAGSKATARRFNNVGRVNRGEHSGASGASQASAAGTRDVYWDVYADCKHCITTLPAFFARQLLPRLVDVLYTKLHSYQRIEMLRLVGCILSGSEFASSMRLLESALSDAAAVPPRPRQESPGPPLRAAQRASTVQPGMPRFVLKSNPAIGLSLEDMELHIQQRVPSNFLDARACMEISDALHRFVFQALSATNFTREKLESASELRHVLMQIVDLLPRECPFIYQAAGSAEQARIACTWSPVFRSAPLRSSPTVIPLATVKIAVKNVCYGAIHAMPSGILVEEWLKLLAWLFTRSAVQSLIAPPASFHPVHGRGDGRDLAIAVAHCLADINSLIASIAENKAKEATNAASASSDAHQLAQTGGNRDRLRHSLMSKLTELFFL